MSLGNTSVKKWSDFAAAFLTQYKFNIDIALDRTSLMVMENSNKKTIREYTHRWKNKAMHVQPPLLKKEMVTLFTDTFKSLYYKHLMGSFTQHFYDIVIAERIEQGIKAGRISKPTKKKGFARRKNNVEVGNVEGGYKGKNNYKTQSYQSQSYQTMSS
jgi:hypothetical protein